MNLPNIEYAGDFAKYIESSDDPNNCICFKKYGDYFSDITTYNRFVKAVENMVRHSQEYKIFVRYVKETLGINFCQVSSNVLSSEKVTVELHHGPIFTLYDYVSVILNKFIDTKTPITTFAIADAVIDEHFALRVQCVMLAKTNHEAVHNGDIFLNIKQGIGNISEFIRLYSPYFTDEQKYKIARYVAMCKDNDSFDNGVLDCDNVAKMVHTY